MPVGSPLVNTFSRWLENTAKNKVRPTTLERYEVLVRLHLKPILGGVRLGKLSAFHIEQCYGEMERNGAGAWTRKMAGTLLSNAFRHAVRQKLIAFNPAADVIKARPEDKEMLFLAEAQTEGLSSPPLEGDGFMPCSPWRSVVDCDRANYWGSNGRILTSTTAPSP